jgi:hypothetical protein
MRHADAHGQLGPHPSDGIGYTALAQEGDMAEGLVTGLVVLTIVTAVRSTWSPCGLSMLSTVTPLAERGRNHRYGVTASWFILGGVLGGATLGAVTAGLAVLVAAFDPSTALVGAVAAAGALVAVASDLQWFGFRLPAHTRQVDEVWLGKYRPWVYGLGFGWQIGVGLATYIMTAGVYLMIVLAALTASPVLAFVIAVGFGTLRGLAVLLGARIESPADLFVFHRRFDAVGPVARLAVIVVQAAIAVGAAASAWGLPGAAVVAALLVLGVATSVRVRPRTSTATA